jgi:pilus assembly protein Flp/PilA
MKRFFDFLYGEDGPTAVEYAVMLALIVGAAMTGITSFGQATLTSFQDSSTRIDTAISGS